ncbi:hypothetical protein [Cumulibacter soli]|uniref:hypothetical protein n=1 Tax=Cumulibacter soli TaxID=2546344 RepID=UPI0010675D43|nr:hypothetical protein [Cumulibacter soli]
MSQILRPFEGIDDVRFGMTYEEVAAVAGAADDTRHDDILDLTAERRGATEYEFDGLTGRLSAMYVFKPGRGARIRAQLNGAAYVPVFYNGLDLLDPDGFAQMCEREPHRQGRTRAGVIFAEIGLVIAGFGKRLPEGKYVIAFGANYVDDYQSWVDA